MEGSDCSLISFPLIAALLLVLQENRNGFSQIKSSPIFTYFLSSGGNKIKWLVRSSSDWSSPPEQRFYTGPNIRIALKHSLPGLPWFPVQKVSAAARIRRSSPSRAATAAARAGTSQRRCAQEPPLQGWPLQCTLSKGWQPHTRTQKHTALPWGRPGLPGRRFRPFHLRPEMPPARSSCHLIPSGCSIIFRNVFTINTVILLGTRLSYWHQCQLQKKKQLPENASSSA